METITQGNEKYLVTGSVKLAVHVDILDVIEDVKKLDQNQWIEILRDGGLTVPAGMELLDDTDSKVSFLAMSFVQNAWYAVTFTGKVIPLAEILADADIELTEDQRRTIKHVNEGHEARIEKYGQLAEKVIKNPPKVKEPKAAKAQKEPKAAKASAPSTARISGRLYTINPGGDAVAVANLTGFRKPIYDVIKAAGPQRRLTMEEVIVASHAIKPYTGKDANGKKPEDEGYDFISGAKNQAGFQLKELAAMNLIKVIAVTEEPEPVATT